MLDKHLSAIRLNELGKVISIIKIFYNDYKNLRILELGAGSGIQAKKLDDLGFNVKAIDIKGSFYSDQLFWPVKVYNGEKIPFLNSSFDIIYSSNVLEHVENIEKIQTEIRRVLKDDGICIHLMPTSSWRFWEILTRFPFSIKILIQTIINKFKNKNKGPSKKSNNTIYNRISKMNKLNLILRAFFPSKHGTKGNAITELYHFSKYRWVKHFKRNNWKIYSYSKSALFYTGSSILGQLLSLEVRRKLSKILGSSCHIFILKKHEKRII